MKNPTLLYSIGAIVVAAGIAFYGGMQYQKKQTPTGFGGRNGGFAGALQNVPAGQRQQIQQDLQNAKSGAERQQILQRYGIMGGRGNGTLGEIIAKDDKSITIKMTGGSTKIVYFSDKTTVAKNDKATAADLTNGKQVNVNGMANSDGSVTAESIQIRAVAAN